MRARGVLVAVALCAGCGDNSRSVGDCHDAIEWRDVRYLGYAEVAAPAGPKLGVATDPCDSQGEEIPVVRVDDVPPEVAVGAPRRGRSYLAEGYLLPLRSHPLHRAVYGSETRPRGPRRRCTSRFDWTARLLRTPDRGTQLNVRRVPDGTEHFVKLHAMTIVEGLTRGGLPYLRRGDLVRIAGVECTPPDGEILRADLISRPDGSGEQRSPGSTSPGV